MKTVNVIEAVFFAALEKKEAGERAAYLDQACNGDPDLRRCVDEVLEALALDEPADGNEQRLAVPRVSKQSSA